MHFIWCILALSATGMCNSSAECRGDATIDFPTNITVGLVYSGSCTFKHSSKNLMAYSVTEGCSVTMLEGQKIIHFNVTCEKKNGSYTAVIGCDSSYAYCETPVTGN